VSTACRINQAVDTTASTNSPIIADCTAGFPHFRLRSVIASGQICF